MNMRLCLAVIVVGGFAGYRRTVYYDQRIKAYRVYYEPIRTDFYSERTEEVARVVFKDGKVASIEQVKE